ncbi:RNA N6-adenosine-methyltransferase METTL16 [Schistosoma japonicum]|nr:RNA N6-adenosine-methyltransferase METTL16 [Schistosoma japonicum]KAH8876069.1 RNA N6-adenosine-methyltransferase METTL16 [Schistosoma japonicum]KAH8876070.1 RNA N6-adenosine-methyltransferase METTL16 [Schistosoma japonicum]
MALNKYMHQRNIYKQRKPNFKELAAQFDFFDAVAVKDECGRVMLDFRTPSHLAALSKALLMKDFGLNVNFPSDRLIPTVPLRLNYILWLEDLIKDLKRFSGRINILDIGVGSSCIYPLLGSKKNSWRFFGTESDIRNFTLAKENVNNNNLNESIKLFHIAENISSLDAVFGTTGHDEIEPPAYIHAVMANPPFFSDASDAIGSNTCRSLKRPLPKTISSAARHESQTTGGEVYFCMRLIRDSIRYSTRVGVFTIMLGKKSSVSSVRRILHKFKITQVSVYEMCQGRIMRWGVAWTFLPNFQFPESDFRRLRKLERPPLILQLPNSITCLPENTVDALLDWLRCEFKQLGMKVLDQKNRAELGGLHLNITATVNTWTHTRRKRREAQRLLMAKQSDTTSNENSTNGNCVFNEESVKCGLDINTTSPKNSLKRIHNNSFETDHSSESIITQEITGIELNTSIEEVVNPPKRTRASLHDEICEEGEDAWFDENDECEYASTNKNNSCSNNELPSSVVGSCSHVIQANVFVEYLNTDSFNKDTFSKSSPCLLPCRINDDDEVMPNNSIECEQTSTKITNDKGSNDCNENVDYDDDVVLLKEDHGPLVIKIAWLSGTCREAANQILFYLKNRLK